MTTPSGEDGTNHVPTTTGPGSPDPDRRDAAPSGYAAPFEGLLVAIGASAGGLDALDRFFSALPEGSGAAFVVIQHLPADHRTMMDALIARNTSMPVSIAEDGVAVRSGHVYVIPAGKMLTLESDRLHTSPRPAGAVTLPIDTFLRSLAQRGGPSAAIILSGTGSDGTLGIEALAQAGGWILIQEPASADFDGMPLNAQATGLADDVLEPEGLATRVAQIAAKPRREHVRLPAPMDDGDAGRSVVELLRNVSRVDFAQYKLDSLARRLHRRMQHSGADSLQAYADRLASHPAEVVALRRELFIPVTRFFRDADAFETLQERALPELVRGARNREDGQLRAWVAGCATGQEAYSVALLLIEAAEAEGANLGIKVFATDVEPTYVEKASQGLYGDAELDGLPARYRSRWFRETEDGRWAVVPELRSRIVFATHDLLADPPFTNLDLVSCRNLLIYLKPMAQERALRRLCYGLHAQGMLFLGLSESPAALLGDFETVENRFRLYRLRRRRRVLPPTDLMTLPAARRHGAGRTLADPAEGAAPGAAALAQRILTRRYAPASVVIDRDRKVVHVFEGADRFLSLPAGTADLDLATLLPPPLGPVATTLFHGALRNRQAGRSRPLRFRDSRGELRECAIEVTPILAEGEDLPVDHAIVSFEENDPIDAPTSEEGRAATLTDLERQRIDALESELSATRSSLEETIQQLGTANEELQATNEELMASNEELQSTNEELQSLNEELYSVNAEYQGKLQEVSDANTDLEGITRATGLPLVFLDGELRITRFTPQATELFQLREADVGRPITDLSHGLRHVDLYARIHDALHTGLPEQFECVDRAGRTWLARIVPGAVPLQGTRRIVLCFVDVSEMRDLRRLQAVLDAIPDHVAVLDGQGTIQLVNRAWTDFAHRNGDETGARTGVGVNYMEVCRSCSADDPDVIEILRGLEGVLNGTRPGFARLYPCHAPEFERWFVMNGAALRGGGCVVTHFDVTPWLVDVRELLERTRLETWGP